MDAKAVDKLFYSIRFESVDELKQNLEGLKSGGIDVGEALFTAVDKAKYQDEPLPLHAACTRNDDDGKRSERALLLLSYVGPGRVQEMLDKRAGAFTRTPLMHAAGKFDAPLVATLLDKITDVEKHLKLKDILGYDAFMTSWNNNNAQFGAAVALYQAASSAGFGEELLNQLDDGNRRMFHRDILPAAEENADDVTDEIAASAAHGSTSGLAGSSHERKASTPGGGANTPHRKKSIEPPQPLPSSVLGPQHFDYRNQVEYEARAKELERHHEGYVEGHPELQQLLHDLMQSLLFHKPQDPLQFIGDHFRNHYTTKE